LPPSNKEAALSDVDTRLLPLEDAVVAWCEPGLIAAVRAAERPFAPEVLMLGERPHLGGGRAEHRPGQRVYSDHLRTESHVLSQAWERLILDFRRLVERESLFLCGVPSASKDGGPRQPIPNAWASDLEFDFVRSTVTRFHVRYVSVRVSLTPVTQPAGERAVAPPAGSETPIRQLQLSEIGDLSDEVVLALVAEHARRRGWPGVDSFIASELGNMNSEQVVALLERHAEDVVRDTSINLLPPGKVSSLALIARKMEERAKSGDMFDKLATEATWLAAWATKAARSHFVVKAKTISIKLAHVHADLKKKFASRD
jgi:hypothetical protein